MPGVPFLYYGDEIGMRYLNLPTKEGGYYRTGSRTPMQWEKSANLGFSTAEAQNLYLPVDPAADAPVVSEQEQDKNSLLNTVKAILALRHRYEDLQADAPFAVVCSEPDRPFLYRRGELLIVVNPSGQTLETKIKGKPEETVFQIGSCSVQGEMLTVGPQSFAILK